VWGGTAGDILLICVCGEAEYFLNWGWTALLRNSLSGKSVDAFASVSRAHAVIARSVNSEAIQTFHGILDCFAYARNDDS
jgi:hypothetical protein